MNEMDFIKETKVVNYLCAYHLWNNIIDDLINDDEELVEISLKPAYDVLLHIARFIDTNNLFNTSDSWEQYVKDIFKNKHDTSTISIWHEPVSDLVSETNVSLEYLFDEMIFVCSKAVENKMNSDSVKDFFEYIVVNYELFEKSVLWIYSIKRSDSRIKTLREVLLVDQYNGGQK